MDSIWLQGYVALRMPLMCHTDTRVILTSTQLGVLNSGHICLTSAQQTISLIATQL